MRRCPAGGKVLYPSRWVAMNAARLRTMMRGVPSLRVYRCPSCVGWHLTKNAGAIEVPAMSVRRIVR